MYRSIDRAITVSTFFLIIILASWSGLVAAQGVDNYAVTRSTGVTYNSIIATGNSFSAWRNTESFIEDDNRSVATDIGFDFWYNGTRYTQFSVSTNGFMDFSSSTDNGGPQCDDYGYCNSEFSVSNNGTYLALAPFYDDMTTAGGIDPLGTSIKYEVSGSAPSRVLTVEWDEMAVYANTTPDLNFQVKIYETTGLIEYLYETMDRGNKTFSYTVGINAASISANPAPAELQTQQTANSNNFSDIPQNNLSTMPAANSRLEFTPPVPANPSGSLSFSAISNTSMTLNWSNWASNEVGYVVYFSTDNVNYFYQSQTAVDVTSAIVNGLLPSTIYYWRVYAVTEGGLSNALSGDASTLAPGTIISIKNGRWDRANTWDCNCIPTTADNVIITSTHIVTIRDSDAACNDLTIEGTNGRLRFNRNTATTLDVNGDITINSGRRIFVSTNSNTTHTLNIRGDLVNNGSLDLVADADSRVATNFIKTDGNQTVSGSGTLNDFYTINIDKSVMSNVLEITSAAFSCDSDALNFISGGTFRFSSTGTNTFSLSDDALTIPSNGHIWMNSTNGIMNFGDDVNLQGKFTLDAGTVNIGDANNENLISYGGELYLNGGSLNVAGRYDRLNSLTLTQFFQTGGELTVPTVGSTSTTRPPFGLDVAGSIMNISGGSIIIAEEGGLGGQNLGCSTSGVTSSTISGGVLQIGNASTTAGQTVLINARVDIGELLFASPNITGELTGYDLNVLGDVTIGPGNLIDNGFDITLAGDWTVTTGSFQSTSPGIVSFVGGNQSITTGGSAFSNLLIAGSGTKTVQDDLTAGGDLTISSALAFQDANFNLSVGGDFINNGSFAEQTSTVAFNGSGAQQITGSNKTTFNNLTISSGTTSAIAEVDLLGLMSVGNSAIMNLGSGNFTLKSSSLTKDGAIGDLSGGGQVNGTLNFERFIKDLNIAPVDDVNGYQYRYLAAPVTGANVAQLSQSGIPVAGDFSDADTPSTTYGSIFLYDATNEYYIYYPANGGTMASNPLNNGTGYVVYSYDMPSDLAITLSGTVVTGGVNVPIIAGPIAGYNLVGNPYPSAIDWDNVTVPAGLVDAIYMTDNTNLSNTPEGAYTTYVSGVGATNPPTSVPGWSGEIAIGQSFWVEATSNTTLSFKEADKTTNQSIYYRQTEPSNFVKVRLTKDGKGDETIINFDGDATVGFDSKYDAKKFKNNSYNLSSYDASQDLDLVINSLPFEDCDVSVNLRVADIALGQYGLEFVDLESFDFGVDIELYDAFLDQSTSINEGSTYDFEVTGEAGSYGDSRFTIRFSRDIMNTSPTYQTVDNCEVYQVIIEEAESQTMYALWQGATKLVEAEGQGGALDFSIAATELAEGNNLLDLNIEIVGCTSTRLTEYVQIEKVSRHEVQSVTDGSNCTEGQVTLMAAGAGPQDIYNWYATALDSVPVSSQSENGFVTPLINETTSYYVGIQNAHGCESLERVEVVASIVNLPTPIIEVNGEVLLTEMVGEAYQWYLNDEKLVGQISNQLQVQESGEYKVEVFSQGCSSTSASITQTILSIEDLNEIGLSIYPNPVIERLYIDNKSHLGIKTIDVLDINGKIVLHQSVNQKTEVDVSQLSKGTYVLLLSSEDQIITTRLIKQ